MRARNPLPPTSHMVGAGIVVALLGWLVMRKSRTSQAFAFAPPPPATGPETQTRKGQGHF